jgi:hypothetical protein
MCVLNASKISATFDTFYVGYIFMSLLRISFGRCKEWRLKVLSAAQFPLVPLTPI